MQFTYRFPAMTTVLRRSAAQASLSIVSGTATARIEELLSHEAPVAATISVSPRDGGTPFRYYEGRFYIEARGGLEGAIRQVDGLVFHAIYDELVSTRRHNAALQPREIKDTLWSAWRHGRTEPPVRFTEQVFPDAIFERMKEFDAGRHDLEQFERWRGLSADLVSQIMIIDGAVWHSTQEPVLAWSVGGSGGRWAFDNLGIYDLVRGRPRDIPAPYGKAGMPGFLGSFLEEMRYWKTANRYYSLPEADRMTDVLRANRDFRIFMPEVFSEDIVAREMVRSARLAVATMRDATSSSHDNDFIRRDEDLAYHYKTLLKLTANESETPISDRLEDALLAFWQYANPREDAKSPYHCGRRFSERGGVAALVGDTLHRWQNRDVSFDPGLTTTGRLPSPRTR